MSLQLETRSREHADAISAMLAEKGYRVDV